MGACKGKEPVDDESRRFRPLKPLSWEKVLAAEVAKADRKPPIYAVEPDWLHEWTKFATSGGSPPGPIQNAPLVMSSRGLHDAEPGWVSAEEWKSLQCRYGGGPALRRWTRELLPVFDLPKVPDTATGGDAVAVETLEPPLRHATQLHEVWRQLLQGDLALEVARLQAGPWAATADTSAGRDDSVSAARACICQAVAGERGAEELRAALRMLRDAGSGLGEDVLGLEALVQALSVHEEAQMVLSCLLEAIQSADRWSLEMWLEHAEAMDLGSVSAGGPLLGPLRVHLLELVSQERRALEGHAEIGVESESAEGRIWRLSLVALDNNDEEALADLVAEGTDAGLDVGAAQLALDELRGRKQQEEEARERHERSSARQQTSRKSDSSGQAGSSAWTDAKEDPLEAWRRRRREENLRRQRTIDEEVEAERRTRRQADRNDHWDRRSRQPDEFESAGDGRGEQHWAQRSGAESPSWSNPSDWRTTDDFLNAWRRRQMEKERQEEQQRKRFQQQQQQSQQQQRQRQQHHHQQHPPRWEQQRPRQPPPSARPPPAAAAPMPVTTNAALAALQLPTGSMPPLAELKKAYRKAALRCHPDRPHNRGRQDSATAEFQRVKAAFDLLAPNAS